jgi:hypothetical protein|tara:strand:+ start:2771 stop:5281 length:2511 start_codon:yes stop_codon:yes gene_type:complete
MFGGNMLRNLVATGAALVLLGSSDLHAEDLSSVDFEGRTLVELIELYRSEGFEIVYSSDLVRPNWRLDAAPSPGLPYDRLQSVLRSFGLQLEKLGPSNWLVTRAGALAATLKGVVVDRFRIPVVDAKVTIGDVVERSDALGMFEFQLEPGNYAVRTLAEGYQDSVQNIRIGEQREQRVQLLLSATEAIEDVIVTASRYELSNALAASQHQLTRAQIENAPTLGDDAIRAINTLPGSANIGFSSRPRVRGGVDDEILVLFDGVELIEPFHLKDFQSLFSTFNPGTIRSVDFYTGGFPARYGNRMSAVLDIATQNVGQEFGGEITISTFSASVLGFGRSSSSDWLAAVRRGTLDVITDIVNPEVGDPSYYDALVRIGRNFDSGARLEFSALNYTDNIELNLNDLSAASEIKNNYQWVKWEDEWLTELVATTILSAARIEHRRAGIADDPDKSVGTLTDRRDFSYFGIKQQIEWKLSEDLLLDGGLYLNQQRADYRFEAVAEIGEIASLLGLEAEIDQQIDKDLDGLAAGLYLSTTIVLSDQTTLQSGLRFDLQTFLPSGSQHQLSPRFSLLHEFDELRKLRISLGRFYQPQGIHELQAPDNIDRFFKPQRSDHVILSYQDTVRTNIEFKTEIFYKRIKITKPRFENLFNPFVVLPEIAQDRIRIDADRAYAKGLEIALANATDAQPYWWLNYAYAKVEDRVDGQWIPRRWDQRHTVNAGVNWQFARWNLSTAAAWHSGWAASRLPSALPLDSEVSVNGIRSNDRYRNFGTLNVRLSRDYSFARSSLTAYIEMANVVNRRNEGGVDYEVEDETDEFILLERDVEPVIPLTTSIGFIWRF